MGFLNTVHSIKKRIWSLKPTRIVFLGYLVYILIGWLLLSLPFMQVNSISSLDNLFISTSAVSTTGLTTISVSDNYTFWGQLVILILIQLGGIGYMTFSSFILLSNKKELSKERTEVSQTVFSLPNNFKIDKFIKSVIVFTVILEFIGAIVLFTIFSSSNVKNPVWSAVFHSISAFCTAGFSLFNTSFEQFKNHFGLNLIISVLSFAGAIGFIVFVDLWRSISGKIQKITLTSKIILKASAILIIGATTLIFITEPTIKNLSIIDRIYVSFFQAMTASTTVGFNTLTISTMSKASLLIITVLMVIGASPSGTGGGIKTTSVTSFFGVMRSALKGDDDVYFLKVKIPHYRIQTAIATLAAYIFILMLGAYLLMLSENQNFLDILFEAASALGTVGLSMGITDKLTEFGKLVITFLMFIGRLGPLTFGISLFKTRSISTTPDVVHDDLAV